MQCTPEWGKACYTHDGKNICIIQRMTDVLARMVFKGGLMNDPAGILELQGLNSRSGYRVKFTGVQNVVSRKANLGACIREAIRVEGAGLKMKRAKGLE